MARTKGSGWGGGVILYQLCPFCHKKKAYYDYASVGRNFRCTACKEFFDSPTDRYKEPLLRVKYVATLKRNGIAQNRTES